MAEKALEVIGKTKTREQATEYAMKDIKKAYGEGAIMKLGEATATMDVEVIPTGCLSLDIVLGVGGYRVTGSAKSMVRESSGKTTIALHVIS